MLTAKQITILQDLILEKQYQLAAKQSENQQAIEYTDLSEQMSHTTDLLIALTDALPENHEVPVNSNSEVLESSCP